MSSNLDNSAANKSISGIGTASSSLNEKEISKHSVVLVSFLSNSIELKLPLSELDINPEDSPQLENIKVETNGIPDETCKAFTNLVAVAESNHSELMEFLSKARNNEPIPPGIFKEQEESLKRAGTTAFDGLHKGASKRVRFVDKSLDGLDSGIRKVFERSEKKRYQQGQLDAVKDNVVPPISAINPMLAPAESVGKVVVNVVAHNVSSGLDNKLKELEISDKRSREDALMAIETKSKLEDYQRDADEAKGSWIYGCKIIYMIREIEEGSDSEANIMSRRIELAGKRILEFILPIKAHLVQIYPYYASGITVVREAKVFCGAVPKILQYVNTILSAKEIIKSSHKFKFEKTVNELGSAIYEYLESMGVVFTQSPIDPTTLEQFVKAKTIQFIRDTKISIYKLYKMLDKHTSSSKCKDAEKKRMAGDRCFNNTEWRNRPLVSPEGVRAYLKKVDAAIDAVYGMSVASLGKIWKTIDGEIERGHVNLDVSDPSIDKVHRVLNEDVEEGLTQFKQQQIGEEPSSRIHRMRERLRFNHKAC